MSEQQAPAGWYAFPDANARLRYWDGNTWSEAGPSPTPDASERAEPAEGTAAAAPPILSLVALVLGAGGVVLWWMPWLGLALAAAAVLLAIVALVRRRTSATATAALVVGAVGLVLSLILTFALPAGGI